MVEKNPVKTRGGGPVWWHPNGIRMRPLSNSQNRSLQIVSASATLTISPDEKSRHRGHWLVTWEIRRRSPCGVSGKTRMSTEMLRRAFGLTEDTSGSDEWLLRHYGADSAEVGCYIRFGNYLNIPHPGTGRDGDPNISVLIDDDIQTLLDQLLKLP